MSAARTLIGLIAVLAPAEIETACVVPMSHVDIGFTAAPRTVAERAAGRGIRPWNWLARIRM